MAVHEALPSNAGMSKSSRAVPTDPSAFLNWENRQYPGYELVGSAVRATAGGTVGHILLAARVMAAPMGQLGRGCSAHQSDLEVISQAGMVTCPDVLIGCGPIDEATGEADAMPRRGLCAVADGEYGFQYAWGL